LPPNASVGFKALWDLAPFDLSVLFTAIVLDGGTDQAGVNDLIFPSLETLLFQWDLEVVEQALNEASLGESFPEEPNRLGIRHAVFRVELLQKSAETCNGRVSGILTHQH
jgi:hypothetical protein